MRVLQICLLKKEEGGLQVLYGGQSSASDLLSRGSVSSSSAVSGSEVVSVPFLITIGSPGVQKVPRNLEPSPHTDHWCRATSRQWSRRGFFIFCLFVSGVVCQVVPQIWTVSLYKLQAESWICFLIEFSLIEWVCSCNFSVRVVLLTCGCCFVCFWVFLQFEAPVSDMQDNNTKQK